MAIIGTGNELGNTLVGNGAANLLAGLGGADVLDGGGRVDTATYVASASGVTVNLTTGTGSGGDAEGDTLVRIESLIGSAQDEHADRQRFRQQPGRQRRQRPAARSGGPGHAIRRRRQRHLEAVAVKTPCSR